MKKILVLIISLFIITGCSNKIDSLKGKWKAIPQNQNVYLSTDETIGGMETYYLECDGKGYYEVGTKSDNLVAGNYKIKKDTVTFYDEGRKVLAICKINDNELDCSKKSYYAFKYTK